MATKPDEEKDFSNLPGPPPYITSHEGKLWELSIDVGQQPIRARACGFGDKDRRPISPPPCVRLFIKDARTGQELDTAQLELSYYVVTVDLWDLEFSKEANLVKHQSASPAISTVSTTAYPRTHANNSYYQAPQPHGGSAEPAYTGGYNASPVSATSSSAFSYDGRTRPSFSSAYSNGNGTSQYSGSAYSPDSRYAQQQQTANGWARGYREQNDTGEQYMRSQYSPAGVHPLAANSGMYTRNLIGNLSASAFRLKDLTNKEGVWFILQDLSVRTEGWFRLKFSFVNLQRSDDLGPFEGESLLIGAGASAPVLASVFSQPFHVWSAKKFPGVIESTPLSRHFAGQGIKIPIRKEGKDGEKKKRKRNRLTEDDYSENEEDDDD